jgi:hypothetical protein
MGKNIRFAPQPGQTKKMTFKKKVLWLINLINFKPFSHGEGIGDTKQNKKHNQHC